MMKRNLSKHMMLMIGLLSLSALILAACQPQQIPVTGDQQKEVPVQEPVVVEPVVESETMEVSIQVATDPVLGDILVDGNGMTLYMFTKDEADKSNCTGGCLEAWPPLLADGKVVAGEGVDASLLGETPLEDGSMIVTYNRMPLYYWVNDLKPGDTTGQDVNQVWYVVSPAGDPISMKEDVMVPVLLQVLDHPEFGEILVDGKGMVLYMFTKDEPNKVNCSGGCLESWPPLLAVDDYTLGDGVNADLVGTAALPDGGKIITYNQMPLYYWVGDAQAGDTNGQGVNDVWYVVSAAGEEVMGMLTGDDLGYKY